MPDNINAIPDQWNTMDEKEQKSESGFVLFMRKMLRRKEAIIGAGVILFLAALALLSPLFFGTSHVEINLDNMFSPPSQQHWFGTDSMGRDLFARILYGGRLSLSIGICSVSISAGGGLIFGAVAGYFGGRADNLIMRFMDIFHSIPQVLLAVIVSTVLGPGFFQTVLAVGVGGIPNFSRTIRANILSVRSLEYVEAAESINCSKPRIIFGHVIPNAITPFIVHCTLAIANGLIVASTLSYIGLGVQPPTPEWGAMLSDARSYVRQYPYLMMIPGVFIMITVMSFNLIGDAVRDALDPKLNK
jgi:peptide/nickel transport system permease protein